VPEFRIGPNLFMCENSLRSWRQIVNIDISAGIQARDKRNLQASAAVNEWQHGVRMKPSFCSEALSLKPLIAVSEI
jgi:hypothetical protein